MLTHAADCCSARGQSALGLTAAAAPEGWVLGCCPQLGLGHWASLQLQRHQLHQRQLLAAAQNPQERLERHFCSALHLLQLLLLMLCHQADLCYSAVVPLPGYRCCWATLLLLLLLHQALLEVEMLRLSWVLLLQDQHLTQLAELESLIAALLDDARQLHMHQDHTILTYVDFFYPTNCV
jgi:hypothetical protein